MQEVQLETGRAVKKCARVRQENKAKEWGEGDKDSGRGEEKRERGTLKR